jgi:hypothetical protein
MPDVESLGPSFPRTLILDLPLRDDAVDRSTYRHDGALSGTALFSEGGLLCNGTTDCGAVVAHRPSLVFPPPWTAMCAVRIEESDLGGLHSLVALDIAEQWAPPFCQIWLTVESQGRINVAAGGDLELVGESVVVDGNWHHAAVVYTGDQLRVYADGVLDGEGSWRGTYVPTVQSLLIGQHPSTGEYLVGRIANLKLYRAALPAATIAALAAQDVVIPG